MKIAISTIAKNEEHNVEDFIKSCKDADLISVLDTGSTDKTQELLKKHNALAGVEIIEPFDFGLARNKALDLLPDDIDVVVSIDLDERLKDGWREALEKVWNEDTEMVSYRYIGEWQDKERTIPVSVSWRSKIFRKQGFRWYNPVHEIPLLEGRQMPKLTLCAGVIVEHLQDGDRDYTKLLTEVLDKDPEYEDGYMQRGADYAKQGKYQEALADYEQYLERTRNEQKKCGNPRCDRCILIGGRRSYSYIEIARIKHKLGYQSNEIIRYFLKAVAEAPDFREAWVYLADGYFSIGNYPMAYGSAMEALKITNPGIHIQEMICWGDYPQQIANSSFSKFIRFNKE